MIVGPDPSGTQNPASRPARSFLAGLPAILCRSFYMGSIWADLPAAPYYIQLAANRSVQNSVHPVRGGRYWLVSTSSGR